MVWDEIDFGHFFSEPLKNGVTRPSRVRGAGYYMVNMGELFANDKIDNSVRMERVPMSDEEISKFLLMPGDLLFARQSLVLSGAGKVSFFRSHPEKCTFESHLIRARLDQSRSHPEFWYYFFKSQHGRQRIESIVEQVAAAGIRGSDLAKLKVPNVPLKQQKQITTTLVALDDKIELNRKMNETLEQMARAIFKSWFIDFDPVHARRQGKKPFGMDDATAALFPDSFEQSELGEIPKGWVISPLGSFVEVVSGTTPKTSEPSFWSPEEHAWATPKDLSGYEGLYLTNTERMISNAGLAEIGSGLLPPGSVLMSSRAPIGYVAIVDMPTAINQGFAGIKVSSSGHRFYMESWCRLNLDVIKNHSNGSTFQEISKSSFKGLQLVAPDARVLEAFSRAVEPLYDLIRNNQLECQALTKTRDLLLPRLLSGELTIKDAIP